MIEFDQKAIGKLKSCNDAINKTVPPEIMKKLWIGGNTAKWFTHIGVVWKIAHLPTYEMDRYQLMEEINKVRHQTSISKEQVREQIIKIFSWGRMKTSKTTGKAALQSIESYESICHDLLCGLNSLKAYEKFFERQNNIGFFPQMKGVGPAFYTKLIYFLGDKTGLIMDQWTAKSVNKLCGNEVIKLENNTTVSKKNDVTVYKRYLDIVSDIQTTLELPTLSKAEELIFSCSHKQATVKKQLGHHHKVCSAWRKYIAEKGDDEGTGTYRNGKKVK
jgi:hypothetical protein